MLGKLMKYEFRSGMRSVGIVWVAMLGMSIIAGVFSKIGLRSISANSSIARIVSLLEGLTMFLYVGLIVTAVVITVMIIIRRFMNGLLGDEGYLMHTLPVSKTNLIASKGFVAAVVLLISILMIILSIVILNTIVNTGQTVEVIKSFFSTLGEYPITILFLIEGIILTVTWLLIVIYKIYLAMAIGQLSNDHRGLIAVGAYFGINIAVTILESIVGVIVVKLSIGSWIIELGKGMGDYTQSNILALFIFVILAIFLIILHIVTEKILSSKLNLQ